ELHVVGGVGGRVRVGRSGRQLALELSRVWELEAGARPPLAEQGPDVPVEVHVPRGELALEGALQLRVAGELLREALDLLPLGPLEVRRDLEVERARRGHEGRDVARAGAALGIPPTPGHRDGRARERRGQQHDGPATAKRAGKLRSHEGGTSGKVWKTTKRP